MNGKSCRYELIFNPMLRFRSWLLSWMPEVCVRISSKEKKNPHEEKSCSCKSNIFYLTYLAVSCLAHTRLGEWFIFDWHGPLDVRDLVCWPGPSMSLDLYVWISYEIPYFFSFQNDQHTVWLLRDSSCISFVALHEHLDIGKRTPLIRNFIDREGRAKRERLTNYPDQCWLTTE